MPAQRTLRLNETQYATILGSCYDGLPDEACGLLTGPLAADGSSTGALSEARPCRNADASARTYTVDPRDMLAAGRAAEARGEEIVGVWHSHTHTDAYPSTTDVRQAVDPTWWYVIVSLRDEAPVLRAYRIAGGVIAESAVELGRG
ncbi:MAG: Mov34/MPN/PAD-1 family protein [Acidimicrobiia bacterium]